MPGGYEWLIIVAVALLLFGGSRLAGLGKGVGRSIREFKEEVKSVEDGKPAEAEVVDAEIVQPTTTQTDSETELQASERRARELEQRERELAARERELRQRETEI